MPVAHIVIFVVLNLIYIEDIPTFDNVIIYFIPFIAITVLGGIWGFNLAIRMMAPHYVNLKLAQKYFAFQLVLFFCKIQPIFLNVVMKELITTCEGPFTIVVKRHSELWKFVIIPASINYCNSSKLSFRCWFSLRYSCCAFGLRVSTKIRCLRSKTQILEKFH